jgi:hypothetical protein
MKKEKLIAEIERLFIHRKDDYAQQVWDIVKSKWVFKRRFKPITNELLLEHLKGNVTIGSYTLNADNTVKWLCFDIEKTDDNKQAVKEVVAYLKDKHNIISYLEFSGGLDNEMSKRYHVWVFLKRPTQAKKVRAFGEYVRSHLGLKIEVFPKNDTLSGKNLGNLVKLPFGVSLKTGKRCEFVHPITFKPYKKLRLWFLKNVVQTDIPEITLGDQNEPLPTENKPFPEEKTDGQETIEDYLPKLKFCMEYVYHKGIQLNNAAGDNFRAYTAWDMACKNIPLDLRFDYFRKQSDFKLDITKKKVHEAEKAVKKKFPNRKPWTTGCIDTMRSNCGSIVIPICKLCEEAEVIRRRMRHGEMPEKIFADINKRALIPIWNDIKETGIQRDGYVDILPGALDKIIKVYGRKPDECRIRWRDSNLLVCRAKTTTYMARVSGKLRAIVRFKTKEVESYLRLR